MSPTLRTADVGREAAVSLREITADTVHAVCDLRVAPGQEGFVAPNAISLAEAHFSAGAWFRAIYAAETPVGFVMLEEADPSGNDPERSSHYLWRLMVATDHQGQGFGRRAMALVVDHLRQRPGATDLVTSYVPGDGCPRDFYRKLGFAETGEVDEGEVVMRLPLDPSSP